MPDSEMDCEWIVENEQICYVKIRHMAIFDIFSKREQRRSGSKPDVFEYNSIAQALRVQIVHILSDVIGKPNAYESPATEIYNAIHNSLAREYGVFSLAEGQAKWDKVINFVLETPETARVLDVIELALSFVSFQTERMYSYKQAAYSKMDVGAAVQEINQRFLEAGVGYQYESGEFVRVDSQFLHSQTVKPVLILLSDKRLAGAEQEFLKAHKHYREGNYKECLTECTKAFESTMKATCDVKGWKYNTTDTAKALIDVLFQNGLIPQMLQSQFNNLRPLLETGVPVMRNKTGAHGQGAVPTAVPDYIAAYALHLTASNILLIVKAAGI